MSNNISTVRNAILIMLDEHEEIHGTNALANELNTEKKYVIKCVRVIESLGKVTIIPSRGGRGNRTIYRRNRNSPGQPRKQA